MNKSREERCKHKITRWCVIDEETKELGEKPLRCLPSDNRSIRQLVGIHGFARDAPSLIYLMYIYPSNFYSNKASRNRILFSFPNLAIHLIASAKPHWLLLAIPQSFLSSKTLSTLWKDVGCVWVQISS